MPCTYSMCMNYRAWFLSLCLLCAISHGMLVDKQCRYETFIAPALIINNITVFLQVYVTHYNYCIAAYTVAMAIVPSVTKTWLQKKECYV